MNAFGHSSFSDFRLGLPLLLGVISGRFETNNLLKNHVVIDILKLKGEGLAVKTHTNKTLK